ncbi:MAG: DUF3500 domain-containing protein, partial [Planctomycetaceae bacterium]|nr:DUF3500 domain-containing protein [Planctomycetaceae bacterium]
MLRELRLCWIAMAMGLATCGSVAAQRPQPPGGPPANLPTVDEVFGRFDSNKDGKLSKDELPESSRERMLMADTDGDGFVSKKELQDSRARAAQGGAAPNQPAPARPNANRAAAATEAPDQGNESDVTKLRGGFRFTEGPAADADGNVFFTDPQASVIYKVDPKGTLTTFLENANGCNGLAFDARRRLIACEGRGGRVIAIDVTTKKIDVIADKFNGQRFISPNDLTIDQDGGVYFSDPAFREGDRPQNKEAVYYVSPDGKVTRVIDDQPRPNGVRLSPDGKTLYVLLSGRAALLAYAVEAPGKLGHGEPFSEVGRPGDGLAVDGRGNLYVTQPSENRIQVLAPDGKPLRSIRVPEAPSNCTLGGPDFKTLFITARTSVYTSEVEVAGAGTGSQPAQDLSSAAASLSSQKPSGVRGGPSSRGVSKTFSNLNDAALIAALKQGGLVIAFRHGVTDWTQKDTRGNPDRESQRNLNDTGRDESKRIGESFKQLGIPVGHVLSSPMWRCRDSAELAFGKVETSRDLLGTVTPQTSKVLSAAPRSGTNTVLVTHNQTLAAALPVAINEVEEGNCIILQPQASGEPKFIAHLAPKDWFRLAGQAAANNAPDNPRKTSAVPDEAARTQDVAHECDVLGKTMYVSATNWLKSLTAAQQSMALFEFHDSERLNWRYEPAPRKGLQLLELTAEQKLLAETLIATALSNAGREQMQLLRSVERSTFLRDRNAAIGPDAYFVTIFGTPAESGTWGWRVEGHHLALNVTVIRGRVVSTTPAFFGAFPSRIDSGPQRGARVFANEEDNGLSLLASLSDQQSTTATVRVAAPGNIISHLTHPARRLEPQGISFAELNEDQRLDAFKLFSHFTERSAPALAAALDAEIRKSPLERLSFAWAGGSTLDVPRYFRLQCPEILIEFCTTQGRTDHTHTVVRHFKNDFGLDSLQTS